MSRRAAHLVAVGVFALAAAGCGVRAESAPEPLPSTGPAIQPPSVTQEPAPVPPSSLTTTPPPAGAAGP